MAICSIGEALVGSELPPVAQRRPTRLIPRGLLAVRHSWRWTLLTFNDLLTLEGIESSEVRLVRHQDSRLRRGRLYEAWRNDREAFEGYQSVQSKDRFPIGDLLAGFVVTEAQKTVFVGIYRVDGVGRCPSGSTDALLKHDISGQFQYDLTLLEPVGRLPGQGRHRLGCRDAQLGPAGSEPAQAGARDRRTV